MTVINRKQNQRMRLIEYLKRHKSIDRIQALEIGIGELPSRICELRKLGFRFEKSWNTYESKFGKYDVRNYTLVEAVWKKNY